jgi:hypothetical protein
MYWLAIAILAYFLLAVVSLFDRYFLVGPISSPKVYTFYIGLTWSFIGLLFAPFIVAPDNFLFVILGLSTGAVRISAALFFTKAIVKSEASRAVPAVGALLPIFSFILFFIFLPGTENQNLFQLLSFILLLSGAVLISAKEISVKIFRPEFIKYPAVAALLFALNFFLLKIVFLKTGFLTGLFLLLLGGGMAAVSLLFFPKNRQEIFGQKPSLKISGLFLLGQIIGGSGVLLQNYAVFLARPGQVPLINAIEGTRYVFLLLFVFILSRMRPEILKEEMRGRILLQKIIAIFLIGTGLVLLAFK